MGDVILKPLFGSKERNSSGCDETAYRVLRAWELNRCIYYIPEYLPHLRRIYAFVVGKFVAAMRRCGTGWKTNYSKGAKAESFELSNEMKGLAVKAAGLIGLEYAGVDILPAENGKAYIIEINSIPGWRGLNTRVNR
jgi:glutathione synthase/RimK-type ligase-like ATP-grasp enzyme